MYRDVRVPREAWMPRAAKRDLFGDTKRSQPLQAFVHA